MKVYVCYEVYDNFCDVFRHVAKVVDTLEKAMEWEMSCKSTDPQASREYVKFEVE